MMHGIGFGTFGWLGMIFNLLAPLAVIIAIIWFLVWIIRKAIPDNHHHTGQHSISAHEILQTRYARGEITREQYQQMLTDLVS